jgi:predicted RNase H-like HicB family nuclease
MAMPAHLQVLEAAQRLCASRREPVFTPDEIVRELPLLSPSTVRTHVTSRCCVNAPVHHASRLDYFRRVGRGRYELLAGHRKPRMRRAERRPMPPSASVQRDTVHAVVTRDGGTYVVDCLEIAVVTQGRTIDEALGNLVEAVALHLEGEDLTALGLRGLNRIHVSYELPAGLDAA